jgi:hypothetical protein
MIWYVIENEHLIPNAQNPNINLVNALTMGWGNGYVAIPPSHCLHSIDYLDCEAIELPPKVHGGLTYARPGDGVYAPKDWWVFGFDTCHWNDNLDNWPKEAVEAETMSMFWQLVELEWGGL